METTTLVNDTTYPGFGTVIEDSDKIKFKDLVKKVGLYVLPIILGGTIGFATGNVLGLMIGVSAGAAFSLSIISLLVLRRLLFSHLFKVNLPQEKNPPQSMLGKYQTADLLPINRVEKSFEWKKRLIQSAETSIEISGNFAGGSKLYELLEIIEQKMRDKPGLKVHFLLSNDLVGNKNVKYMRKLKKEFPAQFNLLMTNRIYSTLPHTHSDENHVKLLVVDEKYFVMGGTGIRPNMARENYVAEEDDGSESLTSRVIMDRCFRDCDLVGEGSIAKEMRRQFFKLYQVWEMRTNGKPTDHFYSVEGKEKGTCPEFFEKKKVIKNARMKFIVGGPEHRKQNPITMEFTKRIQKAQHSIKIASLYFNPDKSIIKALKQKKKESLPIILYGNGVGNGIHKIVHACLMFPARYNYQLVTTAYEYDVHERLYHKKVSTFDDQYTIISSYNLAQKSSYYDYEIACVIKDAKVTKVFNEGLREDEENSKKISPPSPRSFKHLMNKILGVIPLRILEFI